MRIELIAHTITSKRDRNGNCYSFCRFTFTRTGETVFVRGMGGLRGNGLPCKLFGEHGHAYVIDETLPIREWRRVDKNVEFEGAIYEHEALPILREALARARKVNQ